MEKKGLEADHNSPVTIELMDAAAIADAIRDASRHFAHLEKKQRLYVIGLATRGVPLAVRLTEELKKAGIDAVAGSLDPSFHRDDYHTRRDLKMPSGELELLHNVEGAGVLLVDDVLHTGRSVRAALSALLDYGRPKYVRLWVLIERSGRELPIAADLSGMTLEGRVKGDVRVKLKETDGMETVYLVEGTQR